MLTDTYIFEIHRAFEAITKVVDATRKKVDPENKIKVMTGALMLVKHRKAICLGASALVAAFVVSRLVKKH